MGCGAEQNREKMEQNSDRPTSKYDPGMLAKVLSIVGWNVVGPLHKPNGIRLNNT